jgi:uncharacterized protein YbjQ (UPF0145 family)
MEIIMSKTNILVTTTSSLEGIKVMKYLQPISTHVVTGTNIFSDLGASLTDIFGGRSETYQKQLSSIYSEAVENLKKKAKEIKANCILGLKVDIDEISGNGKSMFMITATGTAVIIEQKNDMSKNTIVAESKIDAEKMLVLRKRKDLIQAVKENRLALDTDIWKFITENSVSEIARDVFSLVEKQYLSDYESREYELYPLLLNYISSLQDEDQENIIYECLMSNINKKYEWILMQLLNELQICNFEKLSRYLNDENETIRRKALHISVIDKKSYEISDIAGYESLISIIESKVLPKGSITKQKKMLSSKEVDVWICECKNKNDMEIEYCSSCKKDIYGFFQNEVSPKTAIAKFKNNIEIIKEFVKG